MISLAERVKVVADSITLAVSAKANAMKSVYSTILAHVDGSTQSANPHITDGTLIEILQKQPELLSALRPFLTPDQLELIIREAPK